MPNPEENKVIDVMDPCIKKNCTFQPMPTGLWFMKIQGQKRAMIKLYCAKCKSSWSVAKGIVPKEKKNVQPTTNSTVPNSSEQSVTDASTVRQG